MRFLLPLLLALTGCYHEEVKPDPEPTAAAPDAGPLGPANTGSMPHVASPVPNDLPPPSRSQVVEEFVHGTKVADPYRWLEDEKAAEVVAWMKAQDDYARAHLGKLEHRDWLEKRYRELYYLDTVSAPIKRGGRYFFTRRNKTQEKSVVYWKQGDKGTEKVLLDPNQWSTDNTVSLGTWVPSWDGKKVVFAEKPNAADEATLYVLDVDTGERSKVDVIPGAKYAGPSWMPDNKGFYYEWLPTDPNIKVSERPGYTELRFHKLGADPAKDEVVHEKLGDPKTFLFGGVSKDGKYLFAYYQRGWSENDIWFKRLGKDKEWRLLVQGKDAKYSVAVFKDAFYVLTDEGAPNQRVFRADPNKPERANWKEVVAEDKDANIQGFDVVGGHLGVAYLRKVISEIALFTLEGKPVRKVELPGIGSATDFIGNDDDDEAFYSWSSFTHPPEIFRTSIKTGRSALWAKIEVPIDPKPYVVEQVWFESKDKTKVPMFLVHKNVVQKNGQNPVLMYGYGGFDVSLTPNFSTFIYPWLEAGGIYAVPNLRGGGEFGKAWHDAGMKDHKQNVFDDFYAAAEYLVKDGWTSPGKLAIRGGSNGGLLTGTAYTQRPELFGAVICAVPLLDMVRYHLFGSGKTWIAEYGDPDVQADFNWLLPYSPYHHVKDHVKYPPMLMMSADHDDRVDPMHARKMVARVQQATHGEGTTWLRIEMHSGHGGADQVGKAVESSVDQIAFLMHVFGMKPPATLLPPGEGGRRPDEGTPPQSTAK